MTCLYCLSLLLHMFTNYPSSFVDYNMFVSSIEILTVLNFLPIALCFGNLLQDSVQVRTRMNSSPRLDRLIVLFSRLDYRQPLPI
jgi:hypothetical protein